MPGGNTISKILIRDNFLQHSLVYRAVSDGRTYRQRKAVPQHSVMLTASPPRAGLHVLVWCLLAGAAHRLDAGAQRHEVTRPSRSASEAVAWALMVPKPLRSMQGTCTSPPTRTQRAMTGPGRLSPIAMRMDEAQGCCGLVTAFNTSG